MSRIRVNPWQIFELPEDVVLGPEQEAAAADAKKAMKHPSFSDPSHPNHQQQVEGVPALLTAAYGSPDEIDAMLKKLEKKKGGGG